MNATEARSRMLTLLLGESPISDAQADEYPLPEYDKGEGWFWQPKENPITILLSPKYGIIVFAPGLQFVEPQRASCIAQVLNEIRAEQLLAKRPSHLSVVKEPA